MTPLYILVTFLLSAILFGLASRHDISFKSLLNTIKKSPYKYFGFILALSITTLLIFTNIIEDTLPLFLNKFNLIKPENGHELSIFGFSEFVSALAMLIILYTITGVRYKFRINVTHIPLASLTYITIGFIGFLSLILDVWFKEQWVIPEIFSNHTIWQGTFGFVFLITIMTWIYFAYIRPPIFSEKNYKKFYRELYRVILKGSENELPEIAHELARSSKSLVKHSKLIHRKNATEPTIGNYAYEILLLIGYRKFCRHVIESSPVTAISIFNEISRTNKYKIPIGQFAKNISAEAISNKDSNLYHEDEGYSSGLFGYLKPFSQSIYGDYKLVEELGFRISSPLDVVYNQIKTWDASNYEAYTRAVLTTFENYTSEYNCHLKSPVILRAFDKIKSSCDELYRLDDIPSDIHLSDIYKRLGIAVDFIEDTINLLDDHQDFTNVDLKVPESILKYSVYDNIAKLMFDIIASASLLNKNTNTTWWVQHNIIWDKFFKIGGGGKAWKIINHKLRRLLYNEITELDDLPNHMSAIILRFCLNVMGLKQSSSSLHRDSLALHKAVLLWTKKNYFDLANIRPNIAESCLMNNISFDEKKSRLVKTYIKHSNSKTSEIYFELDK